ncbi:MULTISPECIES: GNAT family N-acetyltransferase [unclassified Nocardia]|uniref:GNAT family N-acetyltransferase n=1 Tax=unclassified Nocardia TaxID=2637762 RepID=UPI001CE48D84|nr:MULTISPECIES: GNAT family N-acetyltransferase [unclassified Nocardia]
MNSTEVVARMATVEEYRFLRRSVGWHSPPDDARTAAALAASLYGVVAQDCSQPSPAIGMGRIIGDGLYGVVVDVIVLPEWQGCAVGTALVENLITWAVAQAIPNLGLVADDLIADFYRRRWPLELSGQYLRLAPAGRPGAGPRNKTT